MTKHSSLIKLILFFSVGGLGLGALIGRLLAWAPALMASVSWNLEKIL